MSDIEQLFTDISPSYDKVNHWLSLGQDLLWRKKAVQHLPWPADTPLQALDLCAGTLDFALYLGKRYANAQIHCLDFSQAMLSQGLQKIPPTETHRYPLHCADATAMPFADQTFDLVICAYGIRNIPTLSDALREIARVLKPGGYLGILEFFRPTTTFTKLFYKTYGYHILPKLGGWISGHEAAYAYLNRSIAHYYSQAEFEAALTRHNFKLTKNEQFIGGISSFILGKYL